MKEKIAAGLIPLLLAFAPESGTRDLCYFNSLKILAKAEGPRVVTMVRNGRHIGQSTLVEEGVLFTYKNREARRVFIAGGFSGWKTMPMERSNHGVWYFFLPAGASPRVTYKFMVDGIWTPDPLNSQRIDDGMGSYLCVVELPLRREGTHVTWRQIGPRTIEFRLYRPKALYVALVGDFNHWNPEMDPLEKTSTGIWRITKKLAPGLYRYKYVVDGDWIPDVYNSRSGSDDVGEVCSLIEIR